MSTTRVALCMFGWFACLTLSCHSDPPAQPQLPPGICPQGMVKIPSQGNQKAYCLDTWEVSVGEYAECIGKGRCTVLPKGRGCHKEGASLEELPVNCVDLRQADIYCKSLKKTLPSQTQFLQLWNTQQTQGRTLRRGCWSEGRPRAGSCSRQVPAADLLGAFHVFDNVSEWVVVSQRGKRTHPGAKPEGMAVGGNFTSESVDMLNPNNRVEIRDVGYSPLVGFRCAREL
jgi:formylglycine-generating enzyme required for sulfatase activity